MVDGFLLFWQPAMR